VAKQQRYNTFHTGSRNYESLCEIKDYNNDEIQGTVYEQEVQKMNQEVYRIEK